MKNLLFALILALVYGLVSVGCAPKDKPVCKFKKGEIVQSVLDARKGQVLRVYDHNCAYNVRFAGDLESQKRSWDVDTVPYAKVYMQEFELKR